MNKRVEDIRVGESVIAAGRVVRREEIITTRIRLTFAGGAQAVFQPDETLAVQAPQGKSLGASDG